MRLPRWIITILAGLALVTTGLASGQTTTTNSNATADPRASGQDLQKMYGRSLLGLNGRLLLQPKLGNCVVDPFDLKEQGFRYAGGLGGIGLTGGPHPVEASRVRPVRAESEAYQDLANTLGRSTASDAAIMVVDDFGRSPSAALGSSIFTLRPSEVSDPWPEALNSYLTSLEESDRVTHGALVYAYTLALVDHLPNTTFAGFVSPPTPADHLLRQAVFKHTDATGMSHAIVVQAVDTTHYRTGIIPTAIDNALQQDRQQFGIDRVAINMSFGIVPCSVRNDFKKSPYDNIDDYLSALQRAGFNGLRENLAKMLFTPFLPDPLHTYIVEYDAHRKEVNARHDKPVLPASVVALASSGNEGWHFPYAPAAWDRVIAVGANYALGDDLAGFSNWAGVSTWGAWSILEDPISVDGEPPRTNKSVVLAGTSFASPGAAVFTALDLMLAHPRCDVLPRMYNLSNPNAFSAHAPNKPLDEVIMCPSTSG